MQLVTWRIFIFGMLIVLASTITNLLSRTISYKNKNYVLVIAGLIYFDLKSDTPQFDNSITIVRVVLCNLRPLQEKR